MVVVAPVAMCWHARCGRGTMLAAVNEPTLFANSAARTIGDDVHLATIKLTFDITMILTQRAMKLPSPILRLYYYYYYSLLNRSQ